MAYKPISPVLALLTSASSPKPKPTAIRAMLGDSAWKLTDLSPCIDAGDPLSPFDPDSAIADMGAYYFYHELGIASERQIEIPDDFCLFPAYPNPFNPSTTIRFGLPTASEVNLTVFNIHGEKVADLVDGYRLAGYHEVTWEAAGLPNSLVSIFRLRRSDFAKRCAPNWLVPKVIINISNGRRR